MTNQLEYKFINLQLLDFDTKVEGNGFIKGHGNASGEIDDGGDIILVGGYDETIEEFKASGWVAHSHDWSISGMVAYPVEAYEDDKGLFLNAEFHSTPDAQAVRIKAAERMRAGKIVGLSIGYRPSVTPFYLTPDKYESELPKYVKPERLPENLAKAQLFSRVRILPKVELREVSIVTSPMNRLSTVTAVKSNEGETVIKPAQKKEEAPKEAESADAKGYFESAMLEREANEGLWRYYDALQSGLRQLREAVEQGEESNPIASLRDLLQAFANRVYNDLFPLFQENAEASATDDVIVLRGLTNLSALIALKDVSRAGMKFDDHSETVLAAVQEFAIEAAALTGCLEAFGERGKAIQDIRAKEGRAISATRMEKMRAACERIKSTMAEMQQVHDHLMAIMDEAMPKPAEEEPKSEVIPEVKEEDFAAEALAYEAAILERRIKQHAAMAA